MPEFFIHSKCCNEHWSLRVDKRGCYSLVCGKCKRLISKNVNEFIITSLQSPNHPENKDLLSSCCKARWDVHYKDSSYELTCSKCKKPATEEKILIIGPNLDKEECSCCHDKEKDCKNKKDDKKKGKKKPRK